MSNFYAIFAAQRCVHVIFKIAAKVQNFFENTKQNAASKGKKTIGAAFS